MKTAALCFALGFTSAVSLIRSLPTTKDEKPTQIEEVKTVHLIDWTGSKLGDLLICSCEPGRLPKGPAVKRRASGTSSEQ